MGVAWRYWSALAERLVEAFERIAAALERLAKNGDRDGGA
jgi:hypothetical protein